MSKIIPFKPGILDINTMALRVRGIWSEENAICFDGETQFYAKISQDNRVLSQRLLPHPEQFEWMAMIANADRDFVRGPAAAAWYSYLGKTFTAKASGDGQKVRSKEAAQILGIGLTKLKQLRQSGKIGHLKMGHRTIWYFKSELEAYKQLKTKRGIVIAI